jgi:hypothetical protein
MITQWAGRINGKREYGGNKGRPQGFHGVGDPWLMKSARTVAGLWDQRTRHTVEDELPQRNSNLSYVVVASVVVTAGGASCR